MRQPGKPGAAVLQSVARNGQAGQAGGEGLVFAAGGGDSGGAFAGHADQVGSPAAQVSVAAELRLFLKPAHRTGPVPVGCDGVSSLGHVIQSLGIPLTEVGRLVVNGRPVPPRYRPVGGDVVAVGAVGRPQPVPVCRFLLDVHLGALARRLRLAGIDTAYANHASDDALLAQANTDRRILLTHDRALLRRRALWLGGYVYGARPDDQFADVLGRFTPPLAPWTRCPICNGLLAAVPKAEARPLVQPGTRRSYQAFSRCASCGQVYWRGAHAKRLEALITAAQRAVHTTAPSK
jgi:uncharacterized protein with PIN domain